MPGVVNFEDSGRWCFRRSTYLFIILEDVIGGAQTGRCRGDPRTRRDQVNVRRSFVRLTALTVVVAMPLLGMSGIASAKSAKATAKCAAHPTKKKCQAAGGGTGTGGSGGGTAPL